MIGLALLQGQITFEQLERLLSELAGSEEEGDPQRLLAGLLRAKLLDGSTLQALQVQVEALGAMLPEVGGEADTEGFVPLASLGGQSRTPEAHQPLTQGIDVTPTRVLWATVPAAGRLAEGHRRLREALTFPRWNQYVDLRFVGEGGMGRIFQAFDPNLKRRVALKFLHRNDPEMAGRLLKEAQRQAQVDHPNICKVYEVREWKGQVYAAMQFIEGTRLDHAVALGLEARVRILETVARAVHAAHRHGLVHRDLKPANIMVETTEDGELKPYVLDFGLARDLSVASETEEGTILGTVHYMAPEQAKGDLARIERRTDVYALGVTLYEGISGHPPFHESHGVECLLRIQRDDIPALGRACPGVARDLETIVMKCLEKEIPLRYESAGALAEDLRRFLEGEPILARRATLPERGAKLVRKHRPVAALLGLALVATLLFAGLGLHAWLTAKQQAQWAQHFGQEAERIEALLRYARLQPVHDIRPELGAVQGRIEAMRSAVEQAGGAALGPGNYALGRAYLALDRPELARAHLDHAWGAGFRTPDAAYAQGKALGRLYLQGIQQASGIQDRALRAERIRELEDTLREPAVALLRQGRGSALEPTEYQEGLLALVDSRFAEAVACADRAAASAPWLYEARVLVAEVALAKARREQAPEQALGLLAEAGRALDEAGRLAPSDPRLCDLVSRRWWEEARLRRQTGLDPGVGLEGMQRACDRWDQLRPGEEDALARRAWGFVESSRGGRTGDPGPGLAKVAAGVHLAEQILGRAPDHAEALGALATGLRIQAYAAMEQGRDPRAELERSILLLRHALERAPSAYGLLDQLATAFWVRIELEKTLGRNPTPILQEAQRSLVALAARFPKVADLEGYLGGFLAELADYESTHGRDPAETLGKALLAFGRALQAQPGRFEFHYGVGNAHLIQAQYQLHQGADPAAALAQAETAYGAALAHNPSAQGVQYGFVEVRLLRAWSQQQRGVSPAGVLAEAERDLAALQAQGGGTWRDAYYQAVVGLVAARGAGDPAQARRHLARAERASDQALAGNPLQHPLHWLASEISLEAARQAPAETATRLRQAKAHLRTVLKVDPGFEWARRSLAQVEAMEALRPGARPEAMTRAGR